MRKSKSFMLEREQSLLSALKDSHNMTITEICELFGISAATARRIVSKMEAWGLLVRTHGGVMYAKEVVHQESLDARRSSMLAEKKAIAREARRMIEDWDNFILCGGTTCMELAYLLMDLKNSVVTTPCVSIANVLVQNPDIKVKLPGGILHPYMNYLVGPDTEAFFSRNFVKKAFMGADAISVEHGITTLTALEADIDKAVIRCVNKTIIMADHTKLGRISLTKLTDIAEVDSLITDSGAPMQYITAIRNTGVEVVLVDAK